MKIVNNRYELSNGVNPLELSEKYGTPLYVYDSAIMKRQYERLENAFNVKKLKINPFSYKTQISNVGFNNQVLKTHCI